MRGALGVLVALLAVRGALAAGVPPAVGQTVEQATVVTEFKNEALIPAHWVLTLYQDGSGHFRSERGESKPGESNSLDAPDVDRGFHVSREFADQVFQAASEHKRFNEECEGHMKVAFQGWKTLRYSGPDGSGSCTFNYSKNKEIQWLSDSITGVAETLIEGARLESLLQHDRLGLDREMEYLCDAVKDGRMREVGAIHEILVRLEDDPAVLDRVRKRARTLLSQPGR
jgi:hypothetical protein